MNASSPPGPCSGATLGLMFRQLRDAMWARMADELATLGYQLTFSQYITLKKLADGTASVSDLARAAELNPGAMTRLLDKLETKGLLARVADRDDRRGINIHLTPAGLLIWQDINQCGMRVRELAMQGMSEADRDQLTQLLTRVRENLAPGA